MLLEVIGETKKVDIDKLLKSFLLKKREDKYEGVMHSPEYNDIRLE